MVSTYCFLSVTRQSRKTRVGNWCAHTSTKGSNASIGGSDVQGYSTWAHSKDLSGDSPKTEVLKFSIGVSQANTILGRS